MALQLSLTATSHPYEREKTLGVASAYADIHVNARLLIYAALQASGLSPHLTSHLSPLTDRKAYADDDDDDDYDSIGILTKPYLDTN